ncbi:MAG: hypothetical protein EXR67_04255 [Dehalococcoidia bacterium]|nr:hypothetical protein [Dehalococcoidia bacterium]
MQVSISFHERALASLPASDLTPEQKQRVQRFIEEQIEDLKVLLQEIDRRASGDTGSQPHRVPFDQPKRP